MLQVMQIIYMRIDLPFPLKDLCPSLMCDDDLQCFLMDIYLFIIFYYRGSINL